MIPDSTPDLPPDVDRDAVQQLHRLLEASKNDRETAYQALAMYEAALRSAHEAGATDAYQSLSRAYREPLIELLDTVTQTEGWGFLDDVIDAYHPSASDEFPHVTTSVQNVASRSLIRTRLADGVEGVPVSVLEYFATILAEVGDLPDYIREGVHPYGWGIGHPDHPVDDRLHSLAGEDIILTSALLEHAFYADQHAAIDVLERIVDDDSIQQTITYGMGEISEVRALLDAPAGVVGDFSPTIPRYWDWQDELEFQFDLGADVEQRIRTIVIENGLHKDLPADWDISDLVL